MREVERDRDARHAVGREPLVRQPEVRLEVDQAARLEFPLQLRDAIREHAVLDADAELAHPQVEELLVRPVLPLLSRQAPAASPSLQSSQARPCMARG